MICIGRNLMKKTYKELELEVVNFESGDVITASGGCEIVDCEAVLTPCPYGEYCGCNEPVSCVCVGVQM